MPKLIVYSDIFMELENKSKVKESSSFHCFCYSIWGCGLYVCLFICRPLCEWGSIANPKGKVVYHLGRPK